MFHLDRYLGPAEIHAALEDLAHRFPDRCRLVSIGTSVEGRDIPLLEITNRRTGPPGRRWRGTGANPLGCCFGKAG